MSDAKKMEELNQRRQKVQIDHARLSAEVGAARREYEALKAEAEREFGTSKLSELEARLANIQKENAATLSAAETELTHAEEAIAKFKIEFSNARQKNAAN